MNGIDLLDKLSIRQIREMSAFSQVCHLLAYLIKKPKMRLENGMLIISIDIDVGSSQLGVLNRGRNDTNVSRRTGEYRIGKLEEEALPFFVQMFNYFEIPVTFAVRGQLAEVNHSFLNPILNSSIKHDVGAHGYYHRVFTNLSRDEANKELNMISSGMKKLGIVPRSFVFPKNQVAHLDLLGKYGYKCYRSRGGFGNDRMYIEKCGELYDVHPSLYFDQHIKLMILRKILDISTTEKLPFHIWFHLWSFGETNESIHRTIDKVFLPFLQYAKRKEKDGLLTFETMISAANKVKRLT